MHYTFRSPKSIFNGIVFLFILLSTSSCRRPLFVRHCSEKGLVFTKTKRCGSPKHGFLAGLICMNKLCLDKQEKINNWRGRKFERFKGKDKDQVSPSHEKKKPRNGAKF
jgi:hypothetical protein